LKALAAAKDGEEEKKKVSNGSKKGGERDLEGIEEGILWIQKKEKRSSKSSF